MANLQESLRRLTQVFVSGVLESLRKASIDDLLAAQGRTREPAAERAPRPGRRPRASRPTPDDVRALADRILGHLAQHSEGRRAEHLRAELKLSKPQLTLALSAALQERRIEKRGVNRGTTYYAAGKTAAAATAATAARPAKRSARKAATKKAAKRAATKAKAPPRRVSKAARHAGAKKANKAGATPKPNPVESKPSSRELAPASTPAASPPPEATTETKTVSVPAALPTRRIATPTATRMLRKK